MADEKISMPLSSGGLTRYFDEYNSKLSLSPLHVIFFIVVVVIFEIAIRFIK